MGAIWYCLVEPRYALPSYQTVRLGPRREHSFLSGHTKVHLWLSRRIQISLDLITPPWFRSFLQPTNRCLPVELLDLHHPPVRAQGTIVPVYRKYSCLQIWRTYRHYTHPTSIMHLAPHRVNHTRPSPQEPRHMEASRVQRLYQWKFLSKWIVAERVDLDHLSRDSERRSNT